MYNTVELQINTDHLIH